MTSKRLMLIAFIGLLVILPGVACTTTYNVYPVITKASDEDATPLELYLKIALPTVLVRAETGTGSGVVFSDGSLVLTAAHVVSHTLTQTDDNGIPYDVQVVEPVAVLKNEGLVPFLSGAQVIKINFDLDLAVLKLARVYPYAKAKFASNDPDLYQKCWASGHPHGVTDPIVTEGRVQDLWDFGFIRYSSQTTFGNSGGPIWIRSGKEFLVSSVIQRVHVEGMGVAVTHLGLGALPSHVRDFVKEYGN